MTAQWGQPIDMNMYEISGISELWLHWARGGGGGGRDVVPPPLNLAHKCDDPFYKAIRVGAVCPPAAPLYMLVYLFTSQRAL